MTKTELRRTGWIAIGWCGIYASALGVFYLVGPFYILLVALVALLLARLHVLDHLITGVACLLFGSQILDQVSKGSPGASLILVSILAMTLAAAKLGRMAGQRVWKHDERHAAGSR